MGKMMSTNLRKEAKREEIKVDPKDDVRRNQINPHKRAQYKTQWMTTQPGDQPAILSLVRTSISLC